MAEAFVYAVARWSRKTLRVQWHLFTEVLTNDCKPPGAVQLSITQMTGTFTAERQLAGAHPSQATLIRNTLENILDVTRDAIALVEVDRACANFRPKSVDDNECWSCNQPRASHG